MVCFPTSSNSLQLSSSDEDSNCQLKSQELSLLPSSRHTLLFQVMTQKLQYFCLFPIDESLVTWPCFMVVPIYILRIL